MPEVVEVSVPILDATEKEQILASYRCVQQCVVKEAKQSMERGWETAFIERKNGWEILGFKHQHDCRVHLGVSYSNWYRCMAVALNFAKLTKAEYLTMKLENAELLGRQPKDVRYDPENIQRAATEPVNVFKARFMDSCTEEKEHWSTFELKMSRDKKEAIEQGLRAFMIENEIDNVSFALELIISEYKDRKTLSGFMAKSIPRLGSEIAKAVSLEELLALRGTFALYVQEMDELLKLCCGESDEQ